MKGRLVMAFGSFDIMHPGHLHYLEKAASLGDSLIVVVARDKTIEQIKKRSPFFDEKSRLALVSALSCVDKAVLGDRISREEDRYKILKKYMPAVMALGYDQRVDRVQLSGWLARNGMHTKIVRIRSFVDKKRFKSSKLRALVEKTA